MSFGRIDINMPRQLNIKTPSDSTSRKPSYVPTSDNVGGHKSLQTEESAFHWFTNFKMMWKYN